MISASTKKSRGVVVIALTFNEQKKSLLEAAVSICERSGFGLRLLHVLVPPPPTVWYGEITAGLNLSDVAEAELEINRNEALFQLEQIAKEVPSSIPIEISVLVDDVYEGILSNLKSKDVRLLICGSVGNSYRFVPNSLSTVLSLMINAPVPVLVLNEAAPHSLPLENLKLLVFDDLSETTSNLFKDNFELFSHIHQMEILHVHVSGLTKATLTAALNTANVAGRSGVKLESEVDDLYSAIEDKNISRLYERSTPLRMRSQGKGIRYDAKIEYGNIQEVIDKLIKKFKPDVLCFGKHKGIHRKPFAIGQVPYSAMLAHKLPIMVIAGSDK